MSSVTVSGSMAADTSLPDGSGANRLWVGWVLSLRTVWAQCGRLTSQISLITDAVIFWLV